MKTDRRRPGLTLFGLLFREAAGPTLLTLLILTVIVLTDDMLRFSDLVLNRGLGAGPVGSMALYKLVPALSWMLPVAVLMGSLIGLGRLGADRELLAIEASGISSPRLIQPMLLFGALAAVAALALSLSAAPAANRALDATLEQLASAKPWAGIRQGKVHHFGEWKLRASEVSADSVRLAGVQLWVPSAGGTVFAARATLDASDERAVRMRLEDGTVFLNPQRYARQIRFENLTVDLPAVDQGITRGARDRVAGLTSEALRALGSVDAQIERHRRLTRPAACLVFAALALPLFMFGARFSRAGGWLLAILSTLVYYGLVLLANGLAEGGVVAPGAAVWMPNCVFAAAALVLGLRLTGVSAFGRHLTRYPESKRQIDKKEAELNPRAWPLTRYVVTRFLQLAALCFGVILTCYLILDVLERVDRFTTYAATATELLHYYRARLPLLVSRVFPMSLVVSTALTVSVLAANGELIGMRSLGIPAPRALLPILVLCAVVAPLFFAFTDQVVPRTTALADYLNQTQIKNRAPTDRVAEVWFQEGDTFFEADLFDPQVGIARNITMYELGADGLPSSRADASWARHLGGGLWRLRDHVRIEVHDGSVRYVDAEPIAQLGETLTPGQTDSQHLSVAELRREIRELEESAIDTTVFRVDLYVKFATPLACLILPALALFYALGGPPYPSSAATLVFSAAVAAGYTLLTGLGASLGYGETLPPALAGLAPVALCAAAAAMLGLRLSVIR